MGRSLLGYATSLYGEALMVPIIGVSLESKENHLPYLVSIFKPSDSMILKGIIVFEALESIIKEPS